MVIVEKATGKILDGKMECIIDENNMGKIFLNGVILYMSQCDNIWKEFFSLYEPIED